MVRKRGKSDVGEKTLLDVLVPVCEALRDAVSQSRPASGLLDGLSDAAGRGLEATRPLQARKGRASFLGERSIGHLDPGARSSQLIVDRVCASLRASREHPGGTRQRRCRHCVALAACRRGAQDMVRQMIGESVPLAACGGNPDGGLGTDVAAISAAIDAAWSERGVAVLVDLGGAEMNAEMAIEMLAEDRRGLVTICNAAIVEGAVMAATEASIGSALADVCAAAEEAI